MSRNDNFSYSLKCPWIPIALAGREMRTDNSQATDQTQVFLTPCGITCVSAPSIFSFFSHAIVKAFQRNFLNWQDTRDNLNFWVTSSRKASLLLIHVFLSPAGAGCSNDHFFTCSELILPWNCFTVHQRKSLPQPYWLANTASNAASCSRPYIIHRDRV